MIENFLIENKIKYLKDESLKKHTTFKVGGKADFVVSPSNLSVLSKLIKYLNENGIKYYFLGNGSNVIFNDQGFKGVIIKSQGFNDCSFDGNKAYFGAGVSMTYAAKLCGEKGLSGIEFCYGIPGNIGGGIFMNAGAYGGEISQNIVYVKYLDENGDPQTICKADCNFGYRHSCFMGKKRFILGAEFELTPKPKDEIISFMEDIMKRRIEKQPLDKPSAGSSFKRPEGYFAAALIDECGLKGKSIGGASVSEKHAGFIVNNGGATCRDIVRLADLVSDTVYKEKGVRIEKEMIIV
ncbi:MAG: UDP-N-acetylmuramate dehydrogenase [Oscillospiraceae bacterium]|nr:UDP-N-acetylmuramate dehydrogenase [Oscillospiraceae bacterium]